MRRALELLALAGLLILWASTAYTLFGPNRLPTRIPIHFDLAGNPDGWGDLRMLWLIPAVATLLYGLMTLVARYPSSFNYPVRVTPLNRDQLQQLALGMIALLKLEVLWLFVWIQYGTIQAVKNGRNTITPGSILLAIAVIFATIFWFVVAARRTARTRLPR